MTKGVVKSQGTELFFVGYANSDPEVAKVACPTGISGLGGAADQLDATCLDSTDREFERGLGNPGPITVPINFIPSSPAHQELMRLQESGQVVDWLMGLSDGTTVPTLDSDLLLVPPGSPLRTSLGWQGYVADFNIDASTNTLVTATLTIQRSGPVKRYFNGPTPA